MANGPQKGISYCRIFGRLAYLVLEGIEGFMSPY